MTAYCDIKGIELAQRLNKTAAERRIPLTGSIDLTHRCNLRCVHCYIPRDEIAYSRVELSTLELKAILSQSAAEGCLFVLLTGGEPLLRPDFAKVYAHAKELGLLVTVFTNATLITEDTLRLFRELPPHAVEVSLYGITAATYQAVTGSAAAHERAMTGIRRLHEADIRLKLKTMLMSMNSHEFHAIESVARTLGVPFRLDAALFPRLDGNTGPLAYRVGPEHAVRTEFTGRERAEDLTRYHERMRGLAHETDLYTCGAGRTSFHIDASGSLKPCLLFGHMAQDVRAHGFAHAWKAVSEDMARIDLSPSNECLGCKRRSLCSFCPAFNRLETGNESMRSDYLCAIGRERLAAIEEITPTMETA